MEERGVCSPLLCVPSSWGVGQARKIAEDLLPVLTQKPEGLLAAIHGIKTSFLSGVFLSCVLEHIDFTIKFTVNSWGWKSSSNDSVIA